MVLSHKFTDCLPPMINSVNLNFFTFFFFRFDHFILIVKCTFCLVCCFLCLISDSSIQISCNSFFLIWLCFLITWSFFINFLTWLYPPPTLLGSWFWREFVFLCLRWRVLTHRTSRKSSWFTLEWSNSKFFVETVMLDTILEDQLLSLFEHHAEGIYFLVIYDPITCHGHLWFEKQSPLRTWLIGFSKKERPNTIFQEGGTC